jgi:NDP-mannose synthase
VDAVIITGGKGTRMAPYTKVLPKGLLPIGEGPILELIIKQLKYYGFNSITLAVGYLAPLIQAYFEDGSSLGVHIQYQVESEPLGTAGPLRSLKNLDQPFLVLNCDVLTTLNLREFFGFHSQGRGLLTVASQWKKTQIHLGVLEADQHRVVRFIEKPTQEFRVSMGIYMMHPDVLRYIPEGIMFDVPDLIQSLLDDGQVVYHYDNDAYWLDIGRFEDYAKAEEDFENIKELLLPSRDI